LRNSVGFGNPLKKDMYFHKANEKIDGLRKIKKDLKT